jgi:hypothetical protein
MFSLKVIREYSVKQASWLITFWPIISSKSLLQSIISFIYKNLKLGVVACDYNPSTLEAQEAEAGGLRVPDHPGLHSKTLQKKNKQTRTKTKLIALTTEEINP